MSNSFRSLRLIHIELLYVHFHVFTLVHDSVHREVRALVFKDDEDSVVYEFFCDSDDFDLRLLQLLQH